MIPLPSELQTLSILLKNSLSPEPQWSPSPLNCKLYPSYWKTAWASMIPLPSELQTLSILLKNSLSLNDPPPLWTANSIHPTEKQPEPQWSPSPLNCKLYPSYWKTAGASMIPLPSELQTLSILLKNSLSLNDPPPLWTANSIHPTEKQPEPQWSPSPLNCKLYPSYWKTAGASMIPLPSELQTLSILLKNSLSLNDPPPLWTANSIHPTEKQPEPQWSPSPLNCKLYPSYWKTAWASMIPLPSELQTLSILLKNSLSLNDPPPLWTANSIHPTEKQPEPQWSPSPLNCKLYPSYWKTAWASMIPLPSELQTLSILLKNSLSLNDPPPLWTANSIHPTEKQPEPQWSPSPLNCKLYPSYWKTAWASMIPLPSELQTLSILLKNSLSLNDPPPLWTANSIHPPPIGEFSLITFWGFFSYWEVIHLMCHLGPQGISHAFLPFCCSVKRRCENCSGESAQIKWN